MARIACGHCGGTHQSVAEVRACSLTSPDDDVNHGAPKPSDGPDGPIGGPGPSAPVADRGPVRPRAAARTSPEPDRPAAAPRRASRVVQSRPDLRSDLDAEVLAGPDALGRSLLIGPDQPVPSPWAQATEVAADAEADPATIERLHSAWRNRERLVIRWTGPLPAADAVVNLVFHQLGPDHEIDGERLLHAVTANTVDARHPNLGFEPLQQALALRGRGGGSAELAPEEPSTGEHDLVLTDGTAVLVDGGPLDLDLVGALDKPVIPRAHLVAETLRPLRARPAPSADLAPDQLAAVAHRVGPARILAPAGSGKTRVLTERARHLVVDGGLTARSVCMVAFNRRAKDEMRDRLLGEASGDGSAGLGALDIRTLNSLALALATGSGPFGGDQGGGRRLSTIDEPDARRLLDRILPGRRRRRLTDPLEPWIDALSACRLGLRDPTEIEQAYGGDVAGFPEILDQYRSALAQRNQLDFDEQIIRAIERLLTDPEARATARSVAPILLIDEFQDLTPAHLLLVRLLAGPAGEVFAVGDDDQTIYGYAGASPDWLIHFERFFPGSGDHRLEVNYRCPPGVVAGAVNLLSHNRRRVPKQIRPGHDRSDDGLQIRGGDPQANLVARVDELLGAGASPGDLAVLTRVNASLLPAAVHLAEAGVPVVRPWGLGPEMLERSGVGAALAWLRLAAGPAQGFRSDDLRLALRRPPRSLHPRVADWASEQASVANLEALAGRLNTEREAETIGAFARDIERLRAEAEDGATTEDLLETVYHEIGLLGAASQLDTSQRSARRAAHADELAAMVSIAPLHPDPSTFDRWLGDRLATIPVFDPDDRSPAVTLATIHTTKGLEWPHVVVHDVRGDVHPHQLATDIEEERRIFHVAVTRGRESVTVTTSGPPSPFVAELAEARQADQPWPEDTEPADPRRRSGAGASKQSSSGGGRSGGGSPAERAEPSSEREAALRESLTEWRRERSKSDGVPAYVVFDNKTLDAIARSEPGSLADLGAINGIGPAKLERYGDEVLGLVASVEA